MRSYTQDSPHPKAAIISESQGDRVRSEAYITISDSCRQGKELLNNITVKSIMVILIFAY